jgi:sigma-E factor negative regulatory protein RseA
MKTWHAYHVVGDVMRSAELAPQGDAFAFLEKLEKRLASESAPMPVQSAAELQPSVPAGVQRQSANAPVLRWKLLAGVACTVLVGTVVVGQLGRLESVANPQLAVLSSPGALESPAVQAVPTLVSGDGTRTVIRDPALDSLLAEHHQLGGHSALQRPSGFLRNATYEGTAR